MFTVEQIQEIACKLGALSRRDSQLPPAHPLAGDEFLALLQDGENRLSHLADVFDAFNRTFVPIMQSEIKMEAFKSWCRSNMVMCAQLYGAIGKYLRSLEDLSTNLEMLCTLYDECVSEKDGLKDKVDQLRNVTLTVKATPENAEVFIDGKLTTTVTKCVGRTVCVAVACEGYFTEMRDIRLTDDIEVEITLERIGTELVIVPYPDSAQVTVNGSILEKESDCGVTVAKIGLYWGDTVNWEVSCDGWYTKSGSFVIENEKELHVMLENDLLERMKAAEERIEKVESDLVNVNTSISQIQTDITGIKNDITNINNAVTNINDSINNIGKQLEGKQDTLEAGYGIDITDNTVSVTIDTTVFKVVSELPDKPDDEDIDKIFIIPSQSGKEGNLFDEYIWVDGKWELLGKNIEIPDIDLSDYYTKEETDKEISGSLGDYYTKNEVDEKIAEVSVDLDKLNTDDIDDIWDSIEKE